MRKKKEFMKSFLLVNLLAVFILSGSSAAQDNLNEGFEEAGTFPPTGWTLISVNSGVYTWHQDTNTPHSGGYCASCDYMIGTWLQEEYLQTPVLDLSGTEEPVLKFWFKGSYAHSVTTNGCDLRVQISTNGGSTYPNTLWSDDTAGPFPENEWTEVTVSLIDFRVPNVTIWWRYIGSTVYQGDKFSVDDISITNVPVPNPAIHVTNLFNDGEGSLRWAIDSANIAPGRDSILFDVYGMIELTEALPDVADQWLWIHGSSSPGGAQSVILDGTNAPSDANGLNIMADYCYIEGLVIQNFNNGIETHSIASCMWNNTISGNALNGVYLNGAAHCWIGNSTEESATNMIFGNGQSGVYIYGNSSYSFVLSNQIGVPSGSSDAGNGGDGITIENCENIHIESNLIANNGGNGINVFNGGRYNTFTENQIYDNGLIGIDLGNDGWTENDENDIDEGPNDLLNYPVIDSIKSETGLPYTIYGHAGPGCKIEFFVARTFDNPEETEDPSGHGEAYSYLGYTDADVNGDFEFVPDEAFTEFSIITCTAIDGLANTSEFALNVEYVPKTSTEPIPITTLADNGPGSLRDAIDQANTHVGEDTLIFDIDGIITLATALPPLTDDATAILGSTAPGGIHSVTVDASASTTGSGLLINSSGNYIEGLVITGAPEDGINIQGAGTVNNTITANHIYDNGELAIDLVDPGDVSPGVTPNDEGDGDVGPNNLINYPEIDSVRSTLYFNDFFIWGKAAPDANVEFYSVYLIESGSLVDDYQDPSGHGEGKYIGSAVCDGAGEFYFEVPSGIDEYSILSATATDVDGSTSEFCENIELIPRPLLVVLSSVITSKSYCPSVVDVMVIDPVGDRYGYDMNGTFFDEIVDAEYHETPECNDSVYILNPLSGTYVIEVVADRNYTAQQGDNPTYTMYIQIAGSPPDTLAESASMPDGGVDSSNYFIGFKTYICGDANADDAVNIADAVFLINYIFKGGPAPDPLCSGDANGDGPVNIADAVYLINYIFKGGPAPAENCCP